MEEQPSKTRRVVRWPEVRDRTTKSRVSAWRGVKNGTFPAPVQLGPNSIGWYEDEIDAWLAAQPRRTYGYNQVAGAGPAATTATEYMPTPVKATRRRARRRTLPRTPQAPEVL
jgi:predicted DNA-binding transcriptional regulator AlpA